METACTYLVSTMPRSICSARPMHSRVTTLIPASRDHPGAGSCIVDHAFSESFLQQLEDLFRILPIADPVKASSSDRSYYCDSENWIQNAFEEALRYASD